jgi:prevent-host-death family protein
MKTIPQRELRNNVGRVLREVEAGARLRITVDGRPVADLVPTRDDVRTFVSRADITRLLARAPLDHGFAQDVAPLTDATIDEL